jgi:hypothetical protein
MPLSEGRHLPRRTNAYFRVDEVHVSFFYLCSNPWVRGHESILKSWTLVHALNTNAMEALHIVVYSL